MPRRYCDIGRLSRWSELRFEVGDALVVEPEAGPGNGLLGPLRFQVADLAEEIADAGSLGEDLAWAGRGRGVFAL